MKDIKQMEVWFATGSQHLYGEETLKKVAEHSQIITKASLASALQYAFKSLKLEVRKTIQDKLVIK